MKWTGLVIATAVAFGAMGGAAMAQNSQSPQARCEVEEASQLDFWLGSWDAMWLDAEGNEVHGSNTITRELDGCMTLEQFDGRPGGPLLGHSISMYVGRLGHWKQIWMDNTGSYLDFSGGPDEEGFHFTMERPSEAAPYLRMIFRNIEEDSFDWHWQVSQDEGETWSDQWHIMYTRAAE